MLDSPQNQRENGKLTETHLRQPRAGNNSITLAGPLWKLCLTLYGVLDRIFFCLGGGGGKTCYPAQGRNAKILQNHVVYSVMRVASGMQLMKLGSYPDEWNAINEITRWSSMG